MNFLIIQENDEYNLSFNLSLWHNLSFNSSFNIVMYWKWQIIAHSSFINLSCNFLKWKFFSLVWVLVLILIRAILKQSINNKMVSKIYVGMSTTDMYLH